jgi:hypothetical protein
MPEETKKLTIPNPLTKIAEVFPSSSGNGNISTKVKIFFILVLGNIFGPKMGMTPEQILYMNQVGAVLIGAQGLSDIGRGVAKKNGG